MSDHQNRQQGAATHRSNPLLAAAECTRPVVIAQFCTALLIRTYDLARRITLLQEWRHPLHLSCPVNVIISRRRRKSWERHSPAGRSTRSIWH